MRRFLASFHKEVRDHRALLVALAVALPALTALCFWVFGRAIMGASASVYAFALPVALGLFVLVVPGDLFASEERRGTIALLRRTPGALRSVLAAKLAFFLVGAACAVAWEWASVQALAPFFGVVPEARVDTAVLAPPLGAVLVVGSLAALVSTWLSHGGAAMLLGALLAAATGIPALLVARRHPWAPEWIFGARGDAVILASSTLVLIGLAAASVAFLRGRRHIRGWARALALGAGILIVGTGSAYGYVAHRLHDGLTVDASSPDIRIHDAFLSSDERHLFLTVGRLRGRHDANGLPTRAWIVDLETGSWRDGGDYSYVTLPPHSTVLSYEAQPVVIVRREKRGGLGEDRWYDGDTGDLLGVTTDGDFSSERARAWMREADSRLSTVRTVDGRRAWLSFASPGWRIEREGAAGGAVLLNPWSHHFRALAHGWWSGQHRHDNARAASFLDASTGRLQPLRVPEFTYPVRMLGIDRVLARTKEAWLVVDLGTGDAQALAGPPTELAVPLGDGFVLVCEEGRFLRWNPETDERADVAWRGPLLTRVFPDGIEHFRGPSGTLLSHYDVRSEERALIVASEDGTLTRLAPWAGRTAYMRPVAGCSDGSFLVIEDYWLRVLRVGPDPDRREVVFPRAP